MKQTKLYSFVRNIALAIVFVATLAMWTQMTAKAGNINWDEVDKNGIDTRYELWWDDEENVDPLGYGIWVGSTQVTRANKNNIPGVIGGKAYIDSTGALVFENVKGVTGLTRGAQVYCEGEVRIKGSVTLNNAKANYGIYVLNDQYFYEAYSLELDGNINATGKIGGICADGIWFQGGNISGTATGANGSGINSFFANTQFDNANVKAKGSTNYFGEYSYAFSGSLTATSTGAGKAAMNVGDLINKGMNIKLVAQGAGSVGLKTDGLYNYAGGLEASGDKAAVDAKYIHVGKGSEYVSPANVDVSGDRTRFSVLGSDQNVKYVKIKAVKEGITTYPVWVGSTLVTSENKDDIPGVTGGIAYYVPEKGMLVLNNVTGVKGTHNGGIISTEADLFVTGNAILSNPDADYVFTSFNPPDVYEYNDSELEYYGTMNLYAKRGIERKSEMTYGDVTSYVAKSVDATAPVINALTQYSDGIMVGWKANKGVSNYRVFCRAENEDWKILADVEGTSYVDTTSKQNGKKYYYSVRGIDKNGEYYETHFNKNGKSIVIQKVAAYPTLTKLTIAKTGNTLKWDKTASSNSYTVMRKENNGAWVRIANVTGVSYVDKNVKEGVRYTYTVCGLSANGEVVTGYDAKGKMAIMVAPELTKVTSANSKVNVAWKSVPVVKAYRVSRKEQGGKWQVLGDTTSLSYTDKTAVVGKTYFYTVQGVTADGKEFVTLVNPTGLSVKVK